MNSVAHWLIVAQCPCGCDSLYFHTAPHWQLKLGEIIAYAIGIDQVSGRYIEILLWAREGVATFLELERLSRGTPRLPSAESIRLAPDGLSGRNLDPSRAAGTEYYGWRSGRLHLQTPARDSHGRSVSTTAQRASSVQSDTTVSFRELSSRAAIRRTPRQAG